MRERASLDHGGICVATAGREKMATASQAAEDEIKAVEKQRMPQEIYDENREARRLCVMIPLFWGVSF